MAAAKSPPPDPQQPRIPLTIPLVGDAEARAASEAIHSGWLAQGPRVARFEAALAERLGAEAAVATSNGTTALELALAAIGVGAGDVVATVSHSFIATANAIRARGATPVFVDVERETRNLDPEALAVVVEQASLAAVVVVHQVGMPAAMARILEITAAANLPVIEDAACAIGSQLVSEDGSLEPIGQPHGVAAAFSFHPRKVITTGEGGAVTTRDGELAARMRELRNHGMTMAADGTRRYSQPGHNHRMSDVHAAIGLAQLDRLDNIVAKRRRLVDIYRQRLESVAEVEAPTEPSWARSCWQSFIATLGDGVDQAAVISGLDAAGIAAQPGIMCAHLEPAYADGARPSLPESERARDRGLTLPLYPQMTDADVERVVDALERVLSDAAGAR